MTHGHSLLIALYPTHRRTGVFRCAILWWSSAASVSSHWGTSCFDSISSSVRSRASDRFLSLKNDVANP